MIVWMTRTEAAEYLRVSKPTLDRWVSEGRLKKRTIAGTRSVRFRRDELDALVEEDQDEDVAALATA